MSHLKFVGLRSGRAGALRAAALLVAAGLCLASLASATVYYVATTGSDGNAGTSSGAPWRTIGKASATMIAGDEVRISPGTYSETLQPVASGTSTNRISYIGSLANPSAVTVNAIVFNGTDYISVKGVQSTNEILLQGNTSGNSANRDSLLNCVGLSGLGIGGAWYCVVANCRIGTGDATDKLNIGVYPGDISTPNASIVAWCTIQDNQFNFATGGGSNAMSFSHMRNNRFVRNQHRLAVLAGATDTHSNTYYRCKDNQFIDCSYLLRNMAGTYETYVFNQRDSSVFNVWQRDTFMVDPTSVGKVKFEFMTSGAYPNTSKYNTWTDCVIKVDGSFGYQNPGRGDVMQGNVFVTKTAFTPLGDSLVFRHNTLANLAGPIAWDSQQADLTRGTVVSNLFYATGSSGAAHLYIPDVASMRVDSNLVYASGNDPSHAAFIRSTASLSAIGSGTPWCTGYGKDCHSLWSDPQFTSASWSALDLRPRSGSPAYLASWPNGYVGAYSAQSLVGDTTPPSAVTNLAAGSPTGNTILLTWNAPGDDGSSGTATAYDIRWSLSPITALNFDAANAFGSIPDPLGSGQVQTFVATALLPSTTYYFALRARDEANNWSAVSNVPSAATVALDTTPPAGITDLNANP